MLYTVPDLLVARDRQTQSRQLFLPKTVRSQNGTFSK